MKIPVSWLREYVAIETPLKELAHMLTLSGTETTVLGEERWNNVFVALVTNVRPHPNADRLRLVMVSLGNEEEDSPEVVCGAPNVAEGQKVAYARVGAELFDGKTGQPGAKLKRSKIRGIVSEGMVCSEKELGLGDNHEGILTLDYDSKVGLPLAQAIGNPLLEIDVTPNRPDCMSVVGIAREISALTGSPLKMPNDRYVEGIEQTKDIAKVEITAPDLCPRYMAGVVKGVTVKPSPGWVQEKLIAMGERPINNIVDITNYVMLELGQPLHAFDANKISQSKVIVRRAQSGERFVTLDDKEHILTGEELMIADSEAGIGIAGVMGGRDSEITPETADVLLEAASFDSKSIRRTAGRLGIQSGASIRFERGLRTGLPEYAIRRAMYLILETAGGSAARGFVDNYPGKNEEQETVALSKSGLKRILGAAIPETAVENTLANLGFRVVKQDGTDVWQVGVPWWRSDIAIEEDLCEEVARIVGYDSLPTKLLEGQPQRWSPTPLLALRDSLVNLLVSTGMQEVITYSAISEENRDAVSECSKRSVVLQNPVSTKHAVMRPNLRNGLLETVVTNLKSAFMSSVTVFECGNVFWMGNDEEPQEMIALAGIFTGRRHDTHWDVSDSSEASFFDAKGAVEFLIGGFGKTGEFKREESSFYTPGRTASVKVDGKRIGMVGEIRKKILVDFDISSNKAAMFELDVAAFAKTVGGMNSEPIKTPPSTPESARDISLLVNKDVLLGNLTNMICKNRLVANAVIFDVYEGADIPDTKKSVAIRIVFQDQTRTLVSERVNKEINSILNALQINYGASIRFGDESAG